MKILFVGRNLEVGGIQKALVNTVKELSKVDNFEIDLFIFGGGPLTKELPENIKVYHGSLLLMLVSTPFAIVREKGDYLHILLRVLCMAAVRIMGSKNFYGMLFKMQPKFEGYDVAISYFNDVQNSYFNQGTNQFVAEKICARKIAWIHTDPIEAGFNHRNSLFTYKNFDKIVCVSKACREKFLSLIPEFKSKTHVVYNFFPIEDIKKNADFITSFEKKTIQIVSVGRIDNASKRFHLIPKISKLLKDENLSNYKWNVIGEGPDMKSNKQLVVNLGVSNFVEFIGEKINPYPDIEKSDLLVLTSAYEGYPMVVGEAIILGTPVLATAYSAAHEQIVNNHNGIITGMDLEDLYLALKDLLKNPERLKFLEKNTKKMGFSNTKAMVQFLEAIK